MFPINHKAKLQSRCILNLMQQPPPLPRQLSAHLLACGRGGGRGGGGRGGEEGGGGRRSVRGFSVGSWIPESEHRAEWCEPCRRIASEQKFFFHIFYSYIWLFFLLEISTSLYVRLVPPFIGFLLILKLNLRQKRLSKVMRNITPYSFRTEVFLSYFLWLYLTLLLFLYIFISLYVRLFLPFKYKIFFFSLSSVYTSVRKDVLKNMFFSVVIYNSVLHTIVVLSFSFSLYISVS